MVDDVAGAPPAAAGAAAPAVGADVAADQPMSRLEIAEAIRQAPLEDQPELLAEYTRTFHQPVPAVLTPSSAVEAAQKIAQLRSDDAWGRKLMAGDIATLEEFHQLSELASSAAPFDPSVEVGDWSSGPGVGDQLSRRNMLSAAEDLRRDGVNEEAIYHFLNGGKFTRETVALAQYYLPRMQADPTLLYPDWPQDRAYQMKAFRMILAAGTEDMP
jgi:hypothetical protein